ncbi:MAG: ribosomal RNA small subunit methyltransferase A [Chloroflexota bacterium]|nr:MAG: ribosomal RNA small subunit methyltransferase A [Chloroflexota bacterium]
MEREVKNLLRERRLWPKKKLGQNFLIDAEVMDDILAAADLSPEDTVVEVGPGLGLMTRELAKRAGTVIAVELDPELAHTIAEMAVQLPNIVALQGNILDLSTAELIGQAQAVRPNTGIRAYKVVANLPYYITSPVLRHFLEERHKPQSMVVMVQKEVAQRIAAKPGDMSILAVSVQVYAHPSIVRYVPARSFYPVPEVDSAVVRLDVYDKPAVNVDDMEAFFRMIHAGFARGRKMLHNALPRGMWLPPGGAQEALEEAGIDSRRRAETLDLGEWERLYWAIRHIVTEARAKPQ